MIASSLVRDVAGRTHGWFEKLRNLWVAFLMEPASNGKREALFVLLVLAINLILVGPDLMPMFSDINPYDEAKYIESGRYLIELEVRDLSWGPLVAVVYAPFHLIFRHMPDWFLIEAWAGRFLLFGSLWLSTFYLATKLKEHTHPYVVIGVIFVNLPFLFVVVNQSDALFASLSALALAKLISFRNNHRVRDVWMGSAFLGLFVLARVESIVLLPLFLALTLIFGLRHHSLKRLLIASLLPSVVIFGFFVLVHRISSGTFDLGIGTKSYESFEVNQPVSTGGDFEEAIQETRRLFGTKEENRGSVIRAILRNPSAFGLRIIANAKRIPSMYLDFFGKRIGPVLFLFALWGVYVLIRKRALHVLGIMFLWSLQPVVSLGFLTLHFIPQICYIPLIVGSIGISDIFNSNVSNRQRGVQLLVVITFALYGYVDNKLAFMMGGFITACVFALAWIMRLRIRSPIEAETLSLMLLLVAGIILRGSYTFPNYPSLRNYPEQQAIHAMQAELPSDSWVLVPFPSPAVAAGMRDFLMSRTPIEEMSSDDFHEWLKCEEIRAIYVDSRYEINPVLSEWIESGVDNYLKLWPVSDEGMIRLLFVH